MYDSYQLVINTTCPDSPRSEQSRIKPTVADAARSARGGGRPGRPGPATAFAARGVGQLTGS
ncbi:hypothetical protein GCM10009835_03870 [Planosporangium flavigriseum]|uniref:Uncharacterized protein n=1 Tax=Planosporangium flavigriseum TaxID=373681 RepID=A0A8J3LTW3_9ACTN|nr:hypothetical protein Pfl04_19550 [Planosporangium flavigriseum]